MQHNTNDLSSKNSLLIAATQLWVGNHEHIVAHIIALLQKTLCPQHGCNTCITCSQVREQQHHAIQWFGPEKTYTKDQFDSLFRTLSFALEHNQHYFFIIQKADFLTSACANRLLKSLEEPPPGYHFILIAERVDQILPTITSRCFIQELKTKSTDQKHPILDFFTQEKTGNPSQFLKALEQSKINERETIELLDILLQHWTHQFKQNLDDTALAEQRIALLKGGFKKPPMPGSSKIFWKNLYLQTL